MPSLTGSPTKRLGVALVVTSVLLAAAFAVGSRRTTVPRGLELLEHVEGPAPTSTPPEGAHNVLLVIGCTFRKDQTSIYDPSLDTTPRLAAFAARGTRFDDLITAAPWTKPASTAILTGRHALSIGMVEEGPRRNQQVLPEQIPTLAQRFHEAGYRTVGATANPNLHHTFGFARGFEHYREPSRDWHGAGGTKLRGDVLGDGLLYDLDQLADDRPFYAQILLVDAHAPFVEAPREEGLPNSVTDYRATLRRLDDAVGHLLDGLDERGLLDDTVVFIVNDHGEGLHHPHHHGKSHGRMLAPSTVGGVGVVVGPGVPAGGRVEGVASQVDLAPTLWSLAGLPPASGWPGLDLSDAVRGRREGTGRARAYTDTWFRKASRAAFYEEGRSCQYAEGDSPLTDRNGVRFELGCFDRVTDPEHRRPKVDRGALRELAAWRVEEHAKGAAMATERREASDDLDGQLRALGYAD